MAGSPESAAILEAMQRGEIEVKGRFLWGSNYVFLVDVVASDLKFQAVYKPTRGERPLWDFPAASLAHRETAAFLVSQGLGWRLVPETVYRRKAPVGAGSLQRFIEHDSELHYFTLDAAEHQRLRPVALFDLLINNADRKGGHVLIDKAGKIWLIDHGLCFHVEDKLRTVIWDFASEPIPDALLSDLSALQSQLEPGCDIYDALSQHLARGELRSLHRRATWLVESGVFPNPHPDRRPYPWPPI
jgi:hypothetical protein